MTSKNMSDKNMSDKDHWPKSKHSIKGLLRKQTQESKVSDNEIQKIAELMDEVAPISPEISNTPKHKHKTELIDVTAKTVVKKLIDQGYEIVNPLGNN